MIAAPVALDPDTTVASTAFLSNFFPKDRAIVGARFSRAIRSGASTPDEVIDHVRDAAIAKNDALSGGLVRDLLRNREDALAYAQWHLALSNMPAEERSKLKAEKTARWQSMAMAKLPPTAKQISLLHVLGDDGFVRDKAEASRRISALKSAENGDDCESMNCPSQCGKSLVEDGILPKVPCSGSSDDDEEYSAGDLGALVGQAAWTTRAMFEEGEIELPIIDFPSLPAAIASNSDLAQVWVGVHLLFACRFVYFPDSPVPLSRQFVAEWCGVSQWKAREGLDLLIEKGAIRVIAEWKRHKIPRGRVLRLFLPADIALSQSWETEAAKYGQIITQFPALMETETEAGMPPEVKQLLQTYAHGMADRNNFEMYREWRKIAHVFEQWVPNIGSIKGFSHCRRALVAALKE